MLGRRAVAVLCLLVLLAGCGPQSPSPSPSPSTSPSAAPAGSGSARLTLPPNWSEVELTEASLQESISILEGTNPELVPTVRWLLDTGAYKTYRLWANGYDGDRMMGNVNMMEVPAEGLTLDGLEPQLAGVFEGMPSISGVASRRVTLPAGDALLFTLDQTMNLADGTPFTQKLRTYALIEDDVVHEVSFSCNPEAPEACLRDVEAMIQTLEIGP